MKRIFVVVAVVVLIFFIGRSKIPGVYVDALNTYDTLLIFPDKSYFIKKEGMGQGVRTYEVKKGEMYFHSWPNEEGYGQLLRVMDLDRAILWTGDTRIVYNPDLEEGHFLRISDVRKNDTERQ